MIVPTQVAFSTIPGGGVWSNNMAAFYMKLGDGDSVQLDNGAILGAGSSPATAWYFANATLVLG